MNNLVQSLLKYQDNLLKNIDLKQKRFLYEQVSKTERLIWIVWLRWVWKTTILLQKLRENPDFVKSIYFSLDNPKISLKWLFLTIEELYFDYWYRYFYVDEIHKYKNWNQELKNIYDSFPDLKLIFSWSSSVDIIKWTYDLSRRVILYKLPILSFREYLNFKHNLNIKSYSLDEILLDSKNIFDDFLQLKLPILKEFQEYLKFWEFPFFISSNEYDYKLKVENIINKIIYEDIASFYQLKTQNLQIFKEIIYFIINSEPWLFSYNSLSKFLSISSETLKVYIHILEEIGLLKLISYDWNISQELRKAKKSYFLLNNVNNLENYRENENLWRIRESFFVSNFSSILKWWLFWNTLKYTTNWDFSINLKWVNYFFEIWWKNKTKKQLKWIDNSFVVKDDISTIWDWVLPLRIFWFMY